MAENVDRDQVLISIDDKLRPLRPLPEEFCIYRVPENLRNINEDAYCPRVVSIGPFHYGVSRLKPMQEHKLRCWQSFIKRNQNNDQSRYVQQVREKLKDIRGCYDQQINLDDDTFVEMVLLDAAFIIESFLRFVYGPPDESFFMSRVLRDLKLEENQLPFFILNDLYSLAFPQCVKENKTFIRLACGVFMEIDFWHDEIAEPENIKHFVDLMRQCYLCSMPDKRPCYGSNHKGCPSVTELHEAGVKFKATRSNDLLDISFRNGVLTIPILTLDTVTLFKNMMVFEQFQAQPNSYISDYFLFLDCLINTSRDVEILVEKGILDNWLGSNKEVAKLINNMGSHIITLEQTYFSHICADLNDYKSRRWHRHRAVLRRKYFSHPWAVISLFYATLLLILAVLQVITGFRK